MTNPITQAQADRGRYTIAPITVKAARAWCKQVHRHLPDVQGGLFATSVLGPHGIVAIGIAGHPARVWMGTGRIVVSRVAALPLPHVTDSRGIQHPAPACTMIFRSICDAARSLGYSEVWTYTLNDETGSSLRAAGFTEMGQTDGGEWDRPSRPRSAAQRPEKKRRWCRILRRSNASAHSRSNSDE